ncbi:helix-turn-helix domain-containing protein [Streptomyces olindensis]|uniref:helix-turn-helix domain-containing protein n=1 Tax=Streptomyces olindensis TaxID=358823 RepID=UPI0036665B73
MEDEEAAAVLRAVGRQIKMWREAAGLKQAELGSAIGYGEEMVSSVERARRIPKPDFLDKADEVLRAGGKLAVMKEDVEKARYPKKVRDLANLQTQEYAQALYAMRRPALSEDEIERHVAARMARKAVFDRVPRPLITFVQEETTLRRPVGGRMVLRRQLEHLLDIAKLRHVSIQVMPTDREDRAGMAGPFRVLKLHEGKTLGHFEAQLHNRMISDPRDAQILDMRYGMIRAQALSPEESLAFIGKVLGEVR